MTFQYQVLANQLAHRIYQDELKPHQKLNSYEILPVNKVLV